MSIAKIKITQLMRKAAVREALQVKFKKRVEAYEKQMQKAISDYALSRKINKDVIDIYDNLTDGIKSLVRIHSHVYISSVGKNGKALRDILTVDCGFKYLGTGTGTDDSHYPFATHDGRLAYYQSTKLKFSKPLLEYDFVLKDKKPAGIQKAFDVRDILIKDIETFAHNTYHALYQVKNLKELREHVPALEQFIPVPEKEFTKLVPYSFFKKVNESVNSK